MKALAPALLAALCAAVASTASSADLKRSPPKNVDLTGLWRINPELSDDPQKVVAKQRTASAEGRSSRGRGVSVDVGGIVFGDQTIGTMRRGGPPSGGTGTGDRPEGDPEPANQKLPLDSFLSSAEEFEIQQRPEEITISTPDESSSCKPSVPSKAPIPGGEMADRHCGWQGKSYVVELKLSGDNEVTRVKSYQLRNDGAQLVLLTEIRGGRTPMTGLQIRTVYDRVVNE